MLYMPVILLFYHENNFKNTEFITLHAIYSIVIAVMEIPSGYLADRWGRKHSLMIGTAFGFIGFGSYSLSYGLFGFILAEILLGLGQSFISGSDAAMIYDTLLEQGKENDYVKYEGRVTSIGNFSEAFAGLAVSIIVFNVIRYYYYVQTVFALFAFLASFFLVEPTVHKQIFDKSFKNMFNIIRYSIKENVSLRYYLIFSSIIGFASLTMAWFAQIIFFEVCLPQHFYGYAWTILNITVGLGSMSSRFIDRRFSRKVVILYLAISLSLGFAIMGICMTLWGLIILSLLFFVRGTAHPILKKYIHQHTDSSQRATVLSIRSLLIRISFFTLAPLIAFVSDKINISLALILAAIPLFVAGIMLSLLILKDERQNI